MKHILDSVHGNIQVEDKFFQIIDTPEFQRLRRIEQTSIRSVFPSARHDRFIHSLGVYNIGSLIIKHLESVSDSEQREWNVNANAKGDLPLIFNSYLIACLLHDVGHAPFSHTFENYYGSKKELSDKLNDLISSQEFSEDIKNRFDDASPHEYVSAYVAYKIFRKIITELGGCPEYVVRMIIGCFYGNKNEGDNQFRNCLISLLHGDLVDADRLDYACRDIWASGYSTSTIDLNRLINALHIRKNSEDDLVVCFYSNVVNEIENLMTIKDFQVKFVINHHTVTYDQWLLQQAVSHTANVLCHGNNSEDDKVSSMKKLCSIDSIVRLDTVIGDYKLYNPSDDDFIALMKQDETNELFKEWISRQYKYIPVWKSPEEFADFFGVKRGESIRNAAFEDTVKAELSEIGITNRDLIILKVTFKPKVKLSSLYIYIHNKVRRFTDIYKDENEILTAQEFYYLYINKDCVKDEEIEEFRLKIVNQLGKVMKHLYPIGDV